MRPVTRFAVLLALFAGTLDAQSLDARSAWLAHNAAPLRSLDIGEADDTDFAPLARAIGDRRIVMLGEQTHGDGATFQAKARIVRFLHERLGFDLLVFESGFYDCRRTWVEVRAGVSLPDSANGCMFELWSNSAQVRPLLTYMDSVKTSTHPLELAGMDFQPSGSNGRRVFNSLGRFLRAQSDTTAVVRDLAVMRDVYELFYISQTRFRAVPDSLRRAASRAVDDLRARELRDVPQLGALGEAAFWRQTVGGVRALAEFFWKIDPNAIVAAVANQRDSVMADNLLWLAQQKPERKIVVWAATSHLVRNRQSIENDAAPKMIPAGHLISQALPGATYTIGFLAAEGAFGIARVGTTIPLEAVPAADSSSLDGLWRDSGQRYAFLDLRVLPPGGDWLLRPIVARPMGYATTRAVWPEHLDGFVFTRQMTPSTQATPRSP
jgi:erythromycin esterase